MFPLFQNCGVMSSGKCRFWRIYFVKLSPRMLAGEVECGRCSRDSNPVKILYRQPFRSSATACRRTQAMKPDLTGRERAMLPHLNTIISAQG